MQRLVKRLVHKKQLGFVNGGYVQHDELSLALSNFALFATCTAPENCCNSPLHKHKAHVTNPRR